jgi:MerR family transcriptional regulator, light-induced transcriptional regulator
MQLRDAANTLGVHYQTAYGWVRQGTLPARKTPGGYEVSDADVRDLMARRAAGVEPPTEIRVRDWAAQADRLYTALMAGDEALARQDFDRLAAGTPLAGLCDQVIAPALRRVGLAWAAGEVSVAEEHRATAICLRLIAARARQPQGRPRGVAVTTTPPGEHHGLPSLMAAACLREDRWQVHDLGPDLPTTELIDFAAEAGAALIVLSSAAPDAVRTVGRQAREIRERLPHVRVLAGRPGDTLTHLCELARAPAPKPNSNPLSRTDPGSTHNAHPARPLAATHDRAPLAATRGHPMIAPPSRAPHELHHVSPRAPSRPPHELDHEGFLYLCDKNPSAK